jgi:hypothetical protein
MFVLTGAAAYLGLATRLERAAAVLFVWQVRGSSSAET